jgi:hypothetical protein
VKEKDSDKSIKARLAKSHTCYVLLTCDGPEEDGQMQVEMSYEGDPVLASYLLQGAQTIIDDDATQAYRCLKQ